MAAPERLVKVVTEVSARGNENVDCVKGDEVPEKTPHSARVKAPVPLPWPKRLLNSSSARRALKSNTKDDFAPSG